MDVQGNQSTTSDTLAKLSQIISDAAQRDKNEADTRHQIIDFILHDYLSWPKNRVGLEKYIHEGFADYILKKSNDEELLFIEAKKEGVYFDLPIPHKADETHGYIQLKKLLSDPAVKAAIDQVRGYCFDSGCEFACVTNGHEWIFFKTHEKSKRWDTLQAFVVRNLSFFTSEYTKAINNLSYVAITERASLPSFLGSAPPKDRTIFYPKEKITQYSHPITANRLASTLRPLVNYYFGVIGDNDTEFMDRCYVSQRDYNTASTGMRAMIQDSLTPYFEDYGVEQLEDTGKGGKLGGRLTKNIKRGRKGEVLVLFGGKGSGKSTFIQRLLSHKQPRWLKDHALVAIIDLLHTPEDHATITEKIWSTLVSRLDPNGLLNADRSELLNGLFSDRYAVAKRQELFGLQPSSEAFNIKLNALVASWKQDRLYCAKQLVRVLQQEDRGVIVVVDNTDQFLSATQDFCFSTAQQISKELECITLISMREERFYNSKIHGLLDAFQNAGFHISSPKPAEVFKKRLEYTISLLKNERKRANLIQNVDPQFVSDSSTYLGILVREFSNDKSPLNSFLTACAHGDIRLSLDLFRSFLLSGYTNVDEMVANRNWNFLIHQVIKPVMIPTRYFYDEKQSEIPNIYQIRHNRNASHFTGLRILRKLSKSTDASTPAYVSVAQLLGYFADTFNMVEDFEKNLDILLTRGFVESNNRLDAYSADLDQIKITIYGMYMANDLAYNFSYLDLICNDCGIYDEATANYLIEAARDEYDCFNREKRVERVKIRLDRMVKFLDYLRREEYREREHYSLGMPEDEMFTRKALDHFAVEQPRILQSALRQPAKRTNRFRGGRKRG